LSNIAYAHAASHVGGPRALMGTPTVALIAPNRYTQTGAAALAWHRERRIDVLASYAPRIAAAAVAARWRPSHEGAVALLIHEHLHLLGPEAHSELADRGVDEGLAATVAIDVLPRIAFALTGRRSAIWTSGGIGGPNKACVKRVRVASTVATGSRNWRAKAARGWRTHAVRATSAERRAMFAAVGMNPADVCPEGVLF
jgi:hypothetical protein